MLPEKPYALSCDRNSEPILTALKELISGKKSLFEVGAGTGQHAIFMAPHFLEMTWTLSDQTDRHEGILMWLKDFPRVNIKGPVEYAIGSDPIPDSYDVVFTANTLHIVSWELCLKLFQDLGASQKVGSQFIVYGAFNYEGKFTSESNERFEKWLKERDSKSGIRDFEKVCDELKKCGYLLKQDLEMPANNRLLLFEKSQIET